MKDKENKKPPPDKATAEEMRKEYEAKGLRWIVDYDCERPRGILIAECENVTVRDIVLYQPGFWSLHILYSKHITIDGIIISNNIEGHGPSTDGIDIDSSEYILVQNANINCNDDNFCLKAGRDSDGLRVNRPCQYVVIRDCVAGSGGGMFTCGSETSGGIRNIVAYRMKGVGTKCGLRFKSTCQRGGVIEDIYLYDIEMIGVERPFVVDLNWNPAYSISKLPKGYDMEKIPVYWSKMLESVSLEQGTPVFRNVTLDNVTASNARTWMTHTQFALLTQTAKSKTLYFVMSVLKVIKLEKSFGLRSGNWMTFRLKLMMN